MSFSPLNLPQSRPEEFPLNDLIGKMLGSYQQATQARYLDPSLKENLLKQQLENQYYGKNIESEIAQRLAQSKLLGEQAKYYGQNIQSEIAHRAAQNPLLMRQAEALGISNPYLAEQLKAEIATKQMAAQKEQLLQNFLSQALGGNQQRAQQSSNLNYSQMTQQDGFPSQNQGLTQDQEVPRGTSQNQTGLNYPQASMLMHYMGMGKPETKEVNGRYIAQTPFGNFDTGIQGLTEGQKFLQKEDAKKLSEIEGSILNNDQRMITYNRINELISSPAFQAIRNNPLLMGKELQYYSLKGTPEQKEMVGQFNALAGNIIKDSARDFAGQFRIGEQALLTNMKPNSSDTVEVMMGKMGALTYLTEMLTKRAEVQSDLMRNQGLSPLQARKEADRLIKPQEIQKQVEERLHPSRPTPEGARAELSRRMSQRMGVGINAR